MVIVSEVDPAVSLMQAKQPTPQTGVQSTDARRVPADDPSHGRPMEWLDEERAGTEVDGTGTILQERRRVCERRECAECNRRTIDQSCGRHQSLVPGVNEEMLTFPSRDDGRRHIDGILVVIIERCTILDSLGLIAGARKETHFTVRRLVPPAEKETKVEVGRVVVAGGVVRAMPGMSMGQTRQGKDRDQGQDNKAAQHVASQARSMLYKDRRMN